MKTSKPWIVLFTVVALALTASVALAAENDDAEDYDDVVFGYDAENHVFVWSVPRADGTLDCRIAPGFYQAKYVTIDGRFWVDDLLDDSGGPVLFPVRGDESAEPTPYAVDGECALSGGEVAGPNGQVNHGMFMKLFNSLFDGPGRGCVVSQLARSDLGKGEQQVRVPDVGEEELLAPESGELEIDSFPGCGFGDESDDEGHGRPDGVGKGRPDHAGKGKPPWAGKPGGPNGKGQQGG